MVKVILAGAGGKMGGRIATFIASTDGIEIAGAFERKGHPFVGRDIGRVPGTRQDGSGDRGQPRIRYRQGRRDNRLHPV